MLHFLFVPAPASSCCDLMLSLGSQPIFCLQFVCHIQIYCQIYLECLWSINSQSMRKLFFIVSNGTVCNLKSQPDNIVLALIEPAVLKRICFCYSPYFKVLTWHLFILVAGTFLFVFMLGSNGII